MLTGNAANAKVVADVASKIVSAIIGSLLSHHNDNNLKQQTLSQCISYFRQANVPKLSYLNTTYISALHQLCIGLYGVFWYAGKHRVAIGKGMLTKLSSTVYIF